MTQMAPLRDHRTVESRAVAAPIGGVLRDRRDHRPPRHPQGAVRVGFVGAAIVGDRSSCILVPSVITASQVPSLA